MSEWQGRVTKNRKTHNFSFFPFSDRSVDFDFDFGAHAARGEDF